MSYLFICKNPIPYFGPFCLQGIMILTNEYVKFPWMFPHKGNIYKKSEQFREKEDFKIFFRYYYGKHLTSFVLDDFIVILHIWHCSSQEDQEDQLFI